MERAYERDRIKVQIEQLQREFEQLTFTISRVKNDEQFELRKLQLEFKNKIENAVNRQHEIQLEITSKKTELERVESRLRETATSDRNLSKIDTDRARRRRL